MSKHTPRSATYWRLCAVVKREEPICWLCGREIDAWRRWPDPQSFSLDHLLHASKHPLLALERTNARASHLVCNQRRGDRPGIPAGRNPSIYLSVDDI